MTHRTAHRSLLALALLAFSAPSWAQDPNFDPSKLGTGAPASRPPDVSRAGKIDIDYDGDLMGLVEYFARATGKNFVLDDVRELEGKKVTIISHRQVSSAAAYEAFLSALEVHGLSIVKVGEVHKIIQAQDAQTSPGAPGEGGNIRRTDQYITQIIPFENIAVSDLREIVDNLVSPNAKVLAYAPSNTLILTDTGFNISRIYDIVSELDVAAPRSSLQIYPIVFADAVEIKELVEELYGTAEEEEEDTSSRSRRRRRRRSRRSDDDDEGVTAGKASNYISKILSDERTNSLIALANEDGHASISDLISKIDIDVDPTSRSQIFVYRLEHAKADDVAQVLQDLANEGRGNNNRGGNQENVDPRVAAARARRNGGAADGGGEEQSTGGAIAAFESGTRIAPDENTNSLVIISSNDDYQVISGVIRELDTRRKQVFVDAVILELSSENRSDFNIGYHYPFAGVAGDGSTGVASGQFGASSLGFSPDLLTGLAFGVFGQGLDVPVTDPTTGTSTTLTVPAFGIAIQAIKTSQMTNIVSTPSLLALDNEEAKIVVGRKIPFPQNSGLNSLGQPVTTFQREDVAITLEITPRINSEDMVTLELNVEVQEVEESADQGNVVQQGGFTTSNRQVETVALVGNNQTVVLGGLVSSTDSESETKIPVLGDLPILGALFRGRTKTARRTNLLIFLTPHIIDDDEDMAEVMRVKEAQRAEFMRRFYGKSEDEQFAEIRRLLQFSMNAVDRPSVYRGSTTVASTVTLDGAPISASSREELSEILDNPGPREPGFDAGTPPSDEVDVDLGGDAAPPAPAADDGMDAAMDELDTAEPTDTADDTDADDDLGELPDDAADTDGEE